MRPRVRHLSLPGLGWGAALLLATVSLAAERGATVDDLLTRTMGFSTADLRTLDAGSPAVRSLDTPVREELALVGVVYVDAPTEHVLDRFRDIEQFEKGPGIPQIGRFSDPPRIEDLASLTLPVADMQALPACRPGDCDVKLSAAAMRRFQNDVGWSSSDATRQANEVTRRMILDLVLAYRTRGNAALGRYDDGDEPLRVAEQFRALLAAGNPVPAPVPALLTYLDSYPHGRPAGVEDFFYWAVVDFGLKQTIRVSHVAIYPLDAEAPPSVAYAIAIKQLYASHYFHTTLELRFLVPDGRRAGRHGTSLVSITRSRNDGMTGVKGLLLRPIVSRRSRDGVRRYLAHMKRQVERPDPTAVTAQVTPR